MVFAVREVKEVFFLQKSRDWGRDVMFLYIFSLFLSFFGSNVTVIKRKEGMKKGRK